MATPRNRAGGDLDVVPALSHQCPRPGGRGGHHQRAHQREAPTGQQGEWPDARVQKLDQLSAHRAATRSSAANERSTVCPVPAPLAPTTRKSSFEPMCGTAPRAYHASTSTNQGAKDGEPTATRRQESSWRTLMSELVDADGRTERILASTVSHLLDRTTVHAMLDSVGFAVVEENLPATGAGPIVTCPKT